MEATPRDVYRTDEFNDWLAALTDPTAIAKITVRIDRLAVGNPGDAEPVGHGVMEMRIHYGPGYRVYFVQHGRVLVVLLCGGTKASQSGDIKIAHELAESVKEHFNGA